MSSRGWDGRTTWSWARRLAVLFVGVSALIVLTQFVGASRKLGSDSSIVDEDLHALATTKHSPEVFALEEKKTIRGHSIAASIPEDSFLERDETFDEDEEFYERMLGKRFGSGPYKSSKSGTKSSKSSKSKTSKSSKSKRMGMKTSKSSKSKQMGMKSKGRSRSNGKGSKDSRESKSSGGMMKSMNTRGNKDSSSGKGSKGSRESKSSGGRKMKSMKTRGNKDKSQSSSKSKGGKKGKKRGKRGKKKKKQQPSWHAKWRAAFGWNKKAPKKAKKARVPFNYHSRKLKMMDGDDQPDDDYETQSHQEKPKHLNLRRKETESELKDGMQNRQLSTTHIETGKLEAISSKFYIYDDPIISQTKVVDMYRRMGKKAFAGSSELDHVKTDMKGEQLILGALQRHPLRTFDPNDAEIFIVNTPITELLAYGCQWENCTWYDEAFDALAKQPTFQKAQGHKHVLVALSWPSFNKRYSAFVPALSRNYHRLQNITVAHNYDPFGCLSLREQTEDQTERNDFAKVYQRELPVTNAFPLGLGFNDPFPVHIPTFEKFETSDYFLFYRSRVKSFAYGSTKYRNAPLDANVIEQLPPSSVGHDVPFEEWVDGFTSSQFCLVIRGDTPHSHSLLYAVRAGCIPVVVSDDYPAYASPFKSSMAMQDFAIFIKEQDFLANPAQQLLKLQELPDAFIRAKLENLYVAQTMVIPNHPRSLFVQAFLNEVIESEKHILPPSPQFQVLEDYGLLSGLKVLYRYPSSLPDASTIDTTNKEPVVIVGVVSKSNRFDARHAIRGTWASESQHRVFFVVAGPWKDIEEEFLEHGDLIWIGIDDHDSFTTNKVQFFLQAVDKHVESYDYIMKTTDDTYVWLDDVEYHLAHSKPAYWGTCKTMRGSSDAMDKNRTDVAHPTYAHGTGYVLSHEFNACAAKHIESSGWMGKEDDVAIGHVAELCGVSCNDNGWDWWKAPTGEKRLKFIHGHMETSAAMLYKHWYVLWRRGGWEA